MSSVLKGLVTDKSWEKIIDNPIAIQVAGSSDDWGIYIYIFSFA